MIARWAAEDDEKEQQQHDDKDKKPESIPDKVDPEADQNQQEAHIQPEASKPSEKPADDHIGHKTEPAGSS